MDRKKHRGPIENRSSPAVEWPTIVLAIIIYGGWLTVTFYWRVLPALFSMSAAIWLCAWHLSLQHELIHGHPTRRAWLNDLMGAPPLNLWLPYELYRNSHRRHHCDACLTDPLEDPESTYMSAQDWDGASPARRWLHCACNTLLGRLALGPGRTAATLWRRQAQLALRGSAPWRMWFVHAFGVAVVLVWIVYVCRISVWVYLAGVIYPATALAMIRSLAEHRAAVDVDDRTAVVENAGLLGFLFLNNNLHILHHLRPELPWYALPAEWRRRRTELLATRQGPVYKSYFAVAARYAWSPHHTGPHPLAASNTKNEPIVMALLHASGRAKRLNVLQ